MSQASQPIEYHYDTSQLSFTYDYLTKPLFEILPPSTSADKPNCRVLDLGCGNGSFCNLLAQRGYDVLGVEESPSGIEIAQQNYPSCEFRQGSIYDSTNSQLQHSFDAVVSIEVIEHLFNPRALVTAARSYLKPGGALILTTPYHGYLKNLSLAIAGKMDDRFTALWDGGHIKFFSVSTLTKLLQTEECKNIKFEFAGRFPYLWKSMICSCNVN